MPSRTPRRSSTPSRRSSTSVRQSARRSARRVTGRSAKPGNHAGIHLLRSGATVRALVESAAPGPDSLVLDLGAGPGTLTAPLARTGARVLAIERDPAFVDRLERRSGG